MLEITCYGGVNEIGGNQIQVEFNKGSIFLDFGQSFKAEGHFFEEFLQPRAKSGFYDLSILNILPQINGLYRQDAFCPEGFDVCNQRSLPYWQTSLKSYESAKTDKDPIPDAVFISHGHLDHCGYIGYLGPIPIYCSPETQTLIKAIKDVGNLTGFESEIVKAKKRIVKQRSPPNKSGFFPLSYHVSSEEAIGRKFEELTDKKEQNTDNDISITGFPVSHSVPGAMMSLIEADDKQILYTGDIRFHGRNNPDLSGLIGLKPDLMISEGTNIEDDTPDDEKRVKADIKAHISDTDSLVMVGFAWKDIERYETVREAAQEEGRIPVFDPRLAYTLARFGRNIYDEDAKVFLERCDSMIYTPGDYSTPKHKVGLMDYENWSSKPATRNTDTIHLTEGVTALDIQRDPSAYVLHLDYYRFKNLLDIGPLPGSTYIRAQCEPFNKRMELSEERMVHWLDFFKINEENDHKPYQCHASGHACGPDLLEFIEQVAPKSVIPIHTEKPNLFESDKWRTIEPGYGVAITLQ